MTNGQQILRDQTQDARLLSEGYVVVPFLTEAEVAALKDFYYSHHSREQEGMYATAHVPDVPFRMRMNDYIKEQFNRAIEAYFVNSNPLGGSYIAKGKGTHGVLRPHQDWNIVDEDHYRSFNVWVPLVDLTDDNGVICIVPGSHTWQKTYRSANIPSVYQDREEKFWRDMQRLYMRAGEALIYDHRLIHASGSNTTDEIRLACVYGVIPQGAQMYYYHQKDADTIEIYHSNPEFFLYNNIFDGPKGLALAGEISLVPPPQPGGIRRLLDKIWPSKK